MMICSSIKQQILRIQPFVIHQKVLLIQNQKPVSKIGLPKKDDTLPQQNTIKRSDRISIGTIFMSHNYCSLLLPIILLAFQFQWIIVLSLIGFRYLFAWLSLGFAAGKLKEKDVMYWFPIIEIIIIFTQLNVFITNTFSKPVHWK